MYLFKTTITRVTGRGAHLFAGVGSRLFNSNGIYNLKDEDSGWISSQSSFQYLLNLEDDREGDARVESVYSAETIQDYANSTPAVKFISLTVYPDPQAALTPETTTIGMQNISLGYNVDAGSVLYIKQGGSLNRITVMETIEEILVIATGATTTTTTSSTSTTSTSSTSSTSSTTSTTSTTTSEDVQYMYWDDGVDYFRLGVRNVSLNLDEDDSGWVNIWAIAQS